MWVGRLVAADVRKAVSQRPALLLTGIRQSGKTSLLKNMFPDAVYINFDNVDIAREAEEVPERFFERLENANHVIIDEIQYVPSLLRELKIRIDADRSRRGKWILTGSQKFSLMKEISESLAGRISILELNTLSAKELRHAGISCEPDKLMFRGGFPELWADMELDSALFYTDYIQTYIERDVRTFLRIGDLRDFQRFLQALAIRCGGLLNISDLSRDVGISYNTVKSWLSVLEASGIIHILPPYFENIGKRLIKTPKLYFADTGLLVSLLRIDTEEMLMKHTLLGSIWENLVISELIITQKGVPGKTLFYYRDSNGVELDALHISGVDIFALEVKTATRPDERKLNFKHVLPSLNKKGYRTQAVVAAPILQGKVFFKDYAVINPLTDDLIPLS